jgi:hypothetical protein
MKKPSPRCAAKKVGAGDTACRAACVAACGSGADAGRHAAVGHAVTGASALQRRLVSGGLSLHLLLIATRPAFFLLVTLTAVLLGLVCAAADGVPIGVHIAPLPAGLTLLFALVAHAGANVINDYYDCDNDAGNVERVYPFTGGSRFIQRDLLSPRAWG